MNDDHKLTILLILKDRFPFTMRWMTYVNSIRIPFKILIADGSKDDRAEELLNDKDRFPNIDYEYLRYPYDETLSHYYTKVAKALTQVATPYVILASNDDFLFTGGIRNAIAFLENHQEYIASRGEICQFSIVPFSLDQEMRYVFGELEVTNPPYFQYPASLSKNPLIRVKQQLKYYCSNFHDVQRTVYVRQRLDLIKKLNPKDLRFADQFNDILTVVNGKVHRGQGLFMIHQSNDPDRLGQRVLVEFPSWFDWIQTSWWNADFKNLSETVATTISENTSRSFNEVLRDFKQIYYTDFIYRKLSEDVKNLGRTQKKSIVLERLKKISIFLNNEFSPLNYYCRIRFSRYFSEFKFIRDFLLTHHIPFEINSDTESDTAIMNSLLRHWFIGIIQLVIRFFRHSLREAKIWLKIRTLRLTEAIKIKQKIKKPRIDNLVVYANTICNAHCKMCDVGVSSKGGIASPITNAPTHMPISLLKKILDDELINKRKLTINFLMTEPLLSKELPRMLELCKKCGHTVMVTTNGFLLSNRASEISSYIDNLQVSLDGPKEIHDSIRGKNFFDAAINGIKAIRELNNEMLIQINYTISDLNYFCLFDFAQFIDSLGIHINLVKFQLLDFVSEMMCQKHNTQFPDILQSPSSLEGAVNLRKVDSKELENQIKLVQKFKPNFIEKIAFKPFLHTSDELKAYFEIKGKPVPGLDKCFTPWCALAINTNGKVFWHMRCFNDYLLGEISQESLRQIFYGQKANYFRDRLRKSNFCFPACTRCCGVMPLK
jgi:glycosyltransferase domain-containing protein